MAKISPELIEALKRRQALTSLFPSSPLPKPVLIPAKIISTHKGGQP